MSRHRNNNFKFNQFRLMGMAFGAILVGGLLGLINSTDASALTCDTSSMVSCIDITFGEIVGGTDLKAPSSSSTSHGIDKAYFYLPVSLTIARSSDYSIKVYSQNGGELRSSNGDVIPTLTGEAGKGTSLQDLGNSINSTGTSHSVWGYRYNLGDKVEDVTKNYLAVPSQNDATANIISREQIAGAVSGSGTGGASESNSATGTIKKVLTLGFATAVDGNLPAGSYSDQIVVAVTATPLQTTAFGTISTMQEMTPEICASATTPSRDAELSDATGIHHGDNRYVPEATLTDIRDGKTYLVRKLADGNCWMGQNLELDILGEGQNITNYKTSNATANDENTAVTANNYFGTEVNGELKFTADDTDLHSTSTWTPDYFKQTYVDTGIAPYAKVYTTMKNQSTNINAEYGWANNGNDGMRSYSYNASNPNWDYSMLDNQGNSTTLSTFKDSATGNPYARRGNLYNWTAATLGSGLKAVTGGQQAEDSICPRGWQLPVNGNTTDIIDTTALDITTNKSFAKLLRAYGMSIATSDNYIANFNRLNEWPLQFMRNGLYHRSYGRISARTTGGIWWSSTTATSTASYARYLYSGSDNVNAQVSRWRGNGVSIRCVAR